MNYILEGKTPVRCDDVLKWAKWFQKADRTVAVETIGGPGGVKVSTVFLGVDYAFGDGEPLLFETMVFGGDLDHETARYCTWEEAEAGHKAMLERIKA